MGSPLCKPRFLRLSQAHLALVAALGLASSAQAVNVETALSFAPVQKDVEYDRPSAKEMAECTISTEKVENVPAWVVRGPAGQVLRAFLDTNGDNKVDQWRYFLNGAESYRDIDTNFNAKADQHRWLGFSGTRWGRDRNEDGEIDDWIAISAEEVTFEVFAAVRDEDPRRFQRVLITQAELGQLGLDQGRATQIANRLKDAPARFRAAVAGKKLLNPQTEWVHFGAVRPGVIPAGTDGSERDVEFYENAAAMLETGGKHGQMTVGTLVRLPIGYRVLDIPSELAEKTDSVASLFQASLNREPDQPAAPDNAISPEVRKLIADLEEANKAAKDATEPAQRKAAYEQVSKILRQLAALAKVQNEQMVWIRQLADTLSAAAQAGEYPEGISELNRLHDELKNQAPNAEVTGFVRFRQLLAEYSLEIQRPKANFEKVQTAWLENLREFVKTYPKAEDTPEAMWQLAIAEELAGNDDEALKWCTAIIGNAGQETSLTIQKARGAERRLTSVGKSIGFKGKTTTGRDFDLQQARGRVVLLHFWASWTGTCDTEMEILGSLANQYGGKFLPVGIALDSDVRQVMAYLKEKKVDWPQLYAEGRLDAPLAVEFGISTVPTMILLDEEGKVIDRNISIPDLRAFLAKKLRAAE